MDRAKRQRLPDLKTWGGSRAMRWKEYDYRSDAVIHVTLCADRGAPFNDAGLAETVCDSVVKSCELRNYRLYGSCLMPNHLHVLLSPGESGTALGVWLSSFKGYTGSQFAARGGRPPLWQRSGNDHVCRDGETAESVLRYIVENPVRAGLVRDWREWPWTRVFIEL